MRPALVSVVLLFSLLQQKTCKLATPEHIQAEFLTKLTPYFSNAKVEFAQIRGENAIIALTCIQGAGPALVDEALQMLRAQRRAIAQLELVPKLGGARYKYIVLGFDSAMIIYDIDSGQMAVGNPTPDYLVGYGGTCALHPRGALDTP
jgi:hypothetical protein